MLDAGEDAPKGAKRDTISTSQLADWLRNGIRASEFVPGQRLVEADITRATGASRTKVREALQRLEAEGLVQIEEFKGASVRRVTFEEVQQIYRARVALEGISAHDFAVNASDADMTRLRELTGELDVAVGGQAHERFNRLNSEWHGLIISGARNAIIAELLGRLNLPIQRLLFESFYNSQRLRDAHDGHKLVAEALLRRDGPAAEAAMRRHIDDAFATLSLIEKEFRSRVPGIR
ncbi:MAG: GntR family transcriptional regulator [Novosphingobium sp.]